MSPGDQRPGPQLQQQVRKGTGYVSLSELPDDEEIPPVNGYNPAIFWVRIWSLHQSCDVYTNIFIYICLCVCPCFVFHLNMINCQWNMQVYIPRVSHRMHVGTSSSMRNYVQDCALQTCSYIRMCFGINLVNVNISNMYLDDVVIYIYWFNVFKMYIKRLCFFSPLWCWRCRRKEEWHLRSVRLSMGEPDRMARGVVTQGALLAEDKSYQMSHA